MAEEGYQPYINDGSDADIAYTCTPCSEDGTREEAFHYCPECDEYLCTTCSKYHLKMKTTRGHKLVNREEGKQRSKSTRHKEKIKCQQHPDRDIEMYCGSHDMVFCLMCIATDHRPCVGVKSITDALVSNFQPKYIKRLKKEAASMKTLLNDVEMKKQENVVLIEKKRNVIQGRIQEIQDSLIEHIKALSEQANHTLEESFALVEGKLESEITMMKKTRLKVERIDAELMSKLEGNREHNFVEVKLCQQLIKDAKALHDKCKSDGQISIFFEENINITEQLLEVNSFGQIYEVPCRRERSIKRQKEVIVRLPVDRLKCRIIDACSLDNGACVLADAYNFNVKLLDTNLRVTDSFRLGGKPGGICKIDHHEIAVRLFTGVIELLTVKTHISHLRSFSTRKSGYYHGFAHVGGKFLVGTGLSIDMYNINGSFVRSINLGQNVVPRQMTTHRNLVFVADYNTGIHCLRSDGSKKMEIRNSRLTRTTGVCVSNDGTIYAFSQESYRIIKFSEDGIYMGELVPDAPQNKVQDSLFYNDKNNSIIVGYLFSDTVTILHLTD